jgi:hypothetical protein
MVDQATPNLPSRSFDATEAFYFRLGFERSWRDDGWMILEKGELCLEFFPLPDLEPETSAFSCCLRLDDLTGFVAQCLQAGIPDRRKGWPRLHPPKRDASGLDIAYLIDSDGTLLRLIQND